MLEEKFKELYEKLLLIDETIKENSNKIKDFVKISAFNKLKKEVENNHNLHNFKEIEILEEIKKIYAKLKLLITESKK